MEKLYEALRHTVLVPYFCQITEHIVSNMSFWIKYLHPSCAINIFYKIMRKKQR